MIADLGRAVTAAMARAQLSATASAGLRKKLIAAVIDPLLLSMTLEQVQGLCSDGHSYVVDEVLQDMTLPQLKKCSKNWNQHRKIPKDMVMRDLQTELRDLAADRLRPTAAPASKPKKTASKRRAAKVAAE